MFREFKVGDLFDIVGRGTRLTKQNRIAGDVPLVTAGRENQGVAEYIQENKQLFRGPVFTIDMFGNVFARDYDFYADDNIIVFGKEGLSINQFLYIASALDYLSSVYGYGNQFRLNSIEKTFIQLPVKPGTDEVNYTEDDIDWAYMESYIHELEESYIHELDAYLKETGLDDYTLTDDEREVLEREPVFKEFEVGELFDGVSGDTDIKKVHLDGDGYPVITAGVDNLGVAGYSSVTAKILPANTLTVDMFGNCYFRPFEYKMVTHARVFSLCLKDGQLTPETGLFVCTMLKWLSTKYNYSNMCSYNKIKNETIQLPVKSGTDNVNYTQDDIDWDYMASYARVTEKQVIADVVDYKNEVIATTKALVKK